MAHGILTRSGIERTAFAVAIAALGAIACGDAAGTPRPPATGGALAGAKEAAEYPAEDRSWGKYHSKRFQLSVSLPDGHGWKIDDHRQAELVAVHPPTKSRLSILGTQEEELMSRQRCEERARSLGWLPTAPLTTVEDQVRTGPDAYDSRVWVGLDAGRRDGSVEGHVFLFGGFLRRCLLVHLVTSVPSGKDEEVLASRLALASTRILGGIALDALRTTEDATLPRDKR